MMFAASAQTQHPTTVLHALPQIAHALPQESLIPILNQIMNKLRNVLVTALQVNLTTIKIYATHKHANQLSRHQHSAQATSTLFSLI